MRSRLGELVAERERILGDFLQVERRQIALACHALARAFARGGTLFAFGRGPAATDAAHVAVEFMHPVIVGKRALPALALTNDPTGCSTLERLARPGDIALGIVHCSEDTAVTTFVERARARELLTIALAGGGPDRPHADHVFRVPSDHPHVVQEVQETLYHVLWELVHVFFEHPGLLDTACITCGDVAVEARVVAVHNGSAVIEKDGVREEIAVEFVEEVRVGDVVLCHAGVALERLA